MNKTPNSAHKLEEANLQFNNSENQEIKNVDLQQDEEQRFSNTNSDGATPTEADKDMDEKPNTSTDVGTDLSSDDCTEVGASANGGGEPRANHYAVVETKTRVEDATTNGEDEQRNTKGRDDEVAGGVCSSTEDSAFAVSAEEAARSSNGVIGRDPMQRRKCEIHRVLPLVPATALLAVVFPWNRDGEAHTVAAPVTDSSLEEEEKKSAAENHGQETTTVTDALAKMEEHFTARHDMSSLVIAHGCCKTKKKKEALVGVLGFCILNNEGRIEKLRKWSPFFC